jgi:hypothetical protein
VIPDVSIDATDAQRFPAAAPLWRLLCRFIDPGDQTGSFECNTSESHQSPRNGDSLEVPLARVNHRLGRIVLRAESTALDGERLMARKAITFSVDAKSEW